MAAIFSREIFEKSFGPVERLGSELFGARISRTSLRLAGEPGSELFERDFRSVAVAVVMRSKLCRFSTQAPATTKVIVLSNDYDLRQI